MSFHSGKELGEGSQRAELKKVFEIAFGSDAIKKDYSRDDVLERLMEFSNKSLELEELEDAR